MSDSRAHPSAGVQVILCWDDYAYRVCSFKPGRNVAIGDGDADVFVPKGLLPTNPMPLLVCTNDDAAVVIPAQAEGHVELDGRVIELDNARSEAEPCDPSGSVRLVGFSRAVVRLGDLTLDVCPLEPTQPTWLKRRGDDERLFACVAAAGVLVGSLLWAAEQGPEFPAPEGPTRSDLLTIQQFLKAAERREARLVAAELAEPGFRWFEPDPPAKEVEPYDPWSVNLFRSLTDYDYANEYWLRHRREETGKLCIIGLIDGRAPALSSDPLYEAWDSPTDDQRAALLPYWGDEIATAFEAGPLGLLGIGEGNCRGGAALGLTETRAFYIRHGAGTGQGFGAGHCPCGCDRSEAMAAELKESEPTAALGSINAALTTIQKREQVGYITEAMVQHRLRLRGLEGPLSDAESAAFEPQALDVAHTAASENASRPHSDDGRTVAVDQRLHVGMQLIVHGAMTGVVDGQEKLLRACFLLRMAIANATNRPLHLEQPTLASDVSFPVSRWYVAGTDGEMWDGVLDAGERTTINVIGYLDDSVIPGTELSAQIEFESLRAAVTVRARKKWDRGVARLLLPSDGAWRP